MKNKNKKKEILFVWVLKFSAKIWVFDLFSCKLCSIVFYKEVPRNYHKNITVIMPRSHAICKAFRMHPRHLEDVFLVQNKTKSHLLALDCDVETVQIWLGHVNYLLNPQNEVIECLILPREPEKISRQNILVLTCWVQSSWILLLCFPWWK